MHESRCGIRCNICERKEKVDCKGCLNMKKPFCGGVCEVKSCCERKKWDHCGECIDFPCEMLTSIGIAKVFYSNPMIEQCRIWAEESRECLEEEGA